MSKRIVVFGATGAQGGSVVKSLNQANKWNVVGITRSKDSDKAKSLAARGVEVVECDLSSSPDKIAAVLSGAHGVFLVSDFWASGSAAAEIQQSKNAIDAAKKAGVEHLIFSSLVNTKKISDGALDVHHFVSKAEIEDYLVGSGVPHTIVQPACYFENYKQMVKPGKDGVLEFTSAVTLDTKFAHYSVEDTGLVVAPIFANKEGHLGQRIAMVGDNISVSEIAQILTKHFGKEVRCNYVPPAVFAKFPFPGAGELSVMFDWFEKYGYYGEKKISKDIWEGMKIAPLRTFTKWVDEAWKL